MAYDNFFNDLKNADIKDYADVTKFFPASRIPELPETLARFR